MARLRELGARGDVITVAVPFLAVPCAGEVAATVDVALVLLYLALSSMSAARWLRGQSRIPGMSPWAWIPRTLAMVPELEADALGGATLARGSRPTTAAAATLARGSRGTMFGVELVAVLVNANTLEVAFDLAVPPRI